MSAFFTTLAFISNLTHVEVGLSTLFLLSDSKLGFNRITCDSYTVKLWHDDELIDQLKHAEECNFFDLNATNQLLAVATKVGVSVWNLKKLSLISEKNIGPTEDVRFNGESTKIIAIKKSVEVYELYLQ